jgi:hypothetical protein
MHSLSLVPSTLELTSRQAPRQEARHGLPVWQPILPEQVMQLLFLCTSK